MKFIEDIGDKLSRGLDNIKNTFEEIGERQTEFLKGNLGQAINSGVNLGIKALLPNCIEDEVIEVKDALLTEGFKSAVNTAIEEATNLGKSLEGILTGKFENVSQIKKATEKGGLIDSISSILGNTIDFAKKSGWISKGTASMLKNGKNAIINTVEEQIDNSLSEQIKAVEKLNGYIEKWEKYYNEQNFTNMEYQYKKIEEYIEDVIPLEETISKARIVENLHEIIKNNGKDFNLSEQEKELAEML